MTLEELAEIASSLGDTWSVHDYRRVKEDILPRLLSELKQRLMVASGHDYYWHMCGAANQADYLEQRLAELKAAWLADPTLDVAKAIDYATNYPIIG